MGPPASSHEGVGTKPSRRPRHDTARLGTEIYERDIRSRVEAAHHGEIVAIDVASGGWALGDSIGAAVQLLRAQHPDALDVWSVRIGHRALYSFGGNSLRSAG